MNILLTNDDGYLSNGILEFRNFLLTINPIYNVFIIAPSSEMSGKSHSFTFFKDISMQYVEENVYKVNGMPADCVKIGILSKLFKVDLVISGINLGANIGLDTFYSGTVAAAREALFHNIPSLAISIDSYKKETKLSCSMPYLKKIFTQYFHIFKKKSNRFTFFNINIPYSKEIKGIRWTTLSMTNFQKGIKNKIEELKQDINFDHYFQFLEERSVKGRPNTDLKALQDNYVSITPLNINSTNFYIYNKVRKIRF